MRTKRKKILYIMFLLITVLMFLHGWKTYVTPAGKSANYVKKHDKDKKNKKHSDHHSKPQHKQIKNPVLQA